MNYNEKTILLREAALSPESVGDNHYKKLLEANVEIPISSKQSRLVNSFSMGADPEFGLVSATGQVLYADAYLVQSYGSAFGADGSGRPVELRPAPNRSCVKVVASLLETLRWLCLYRPQIVPFQWLTGGYGGGMSLGGHIHFGRVSDKGTRKVEVQALDNLCLILDKLELFPGQNSRRNSMSDYGRPGDFRVQMFGYEYRTPPSWLFSPHFTHFVLTLAKLAVHEPKTMMGFNGKTPIQSEGKQRLWNVLSYYRYFDDDAALAALNMADVIASKPSCYMDFKAAWGLPTSITPVTGWQGSDKLPIELAPSPEAIEDSFKSIKTRTAPEWKIPTKQLDRFQLPDTETAKLVRSYSLEQFGNGVRVWSLNGFRNVNYFPTLSDAEKLKLFFFTTPNLLACLTRKELTRFKSEVKNLGFGFKPMENQRGEGVEVAAYYYDSIQSIQVKRLYRIILNGCFPCSRLDRYDDKFFSEWRKRFKSIGIEPSAQGG